MSLDSTELLSVAVARMIDAQRRDMMSYTECKAGPWGRWARRSQEGQILPSLCLPLHLCYRSDPGMVGTKHDRARAIRVHSRTGPLLLVSCLLHQRSHVPSICS